MSLIHMIKLQQGTSTTTKIVCDTRIEPREKRKIIFLMTIELFVFGLIKFE